MLRIEGHFFLCLSASTCVTRDNEPGVLFALREPAPAEGFPNGLLAVWVGDQALAFLRAHGAELRPGRGLHLSLNKLQARDGDIRARVLACELLPPPPSWQRNQQQLTQAAPA
jgi:hypothetical protein